MSNPYPICELIKNRLAAGVTHITADRIFISRPSTIFVGEGPVILIYPLGGDREARTGDRRFVFDSSIVDGFSIDVLVDDLVNDALNTEAIKVCTAIAYQVEKALFSDINAALYDLSEQGYEVEGYGPGKSVTYDVSSDKGTMIAMGNQLRVIYTEDWRIEERTDELARHVGTLKGDTIERGFVIEPTE
jgi:hypothetical protein